MAHGINADALQDAARLVISTVDEFKTALKQVETMQALADEANANLNRAKQHLETCRAKARKAKEAVAQLGDESEVADSSSPHNAADLPS